MLRKLLLSTSILLFSAGVQASGSGQTIEQIFYCGDDFAMKMSGGEWYLVQKSRVGERKQDHFLSMALYAMAAGKKTANVFPEPAIDNWCGNTGFRPIKIFSVQS